MVWSLLFEQMGIARGIANLASCMYVTLCKTTSDVDIIHVSLLGGLIATQCFVHFPDTREISLHKYYTRVLTVPHM